MKILAHGREFCALCTELCLDFLAFSVYKYSWQTTEVIPALRLDKQRI